MPEEFDLAAYEVGGCAHALVELEARRGLKG